MNYTLEQINELKLEDVESIILMRLELEEGQEATEEQLQAEFEAYKAELIEVEKARLEEQSRIADLHSRYDAMDDKGLIQGLCDIQNPDAYFMREILQADKEEAESKLANIEAKYQAEVERIASLEWLEKRKQEYSTIDTLLFEAIAEKEAGRPEKMEAYLLLREEIRDNNPKPE